MIESTSSSRAGRGPSEKTTFRPGVVGDPAFRACADRSWPIREAMASHVSAQGATASAPTYAGTLKIVSIRESVSVPAGQFETVRFPLSGRAPRPADLRLAGPGAEDVTQTKPRLTLPKFPMSGKTAGRSAVRTPNHEAKVAPY